MADYKLLELKRKPRLVATQDRKETSFWEKFQSPIVIKEFGAVTSVDFSPVKPYDYAVTAGSRVQVYSSTSNTVKKTISRFKQTASCAQFRHDGQLLVAGGDEGIVRVFDMSSRFILRQLKGHTKCVKAVNFTADGVHIVSGSDDTVLRYWDMATENSIAELHGHQDYIRCLSVCPATPNVILTGSYDHTVLGWDLRTSVSSFQLNHGAPVECVLMFPSGATCVTAGANYVKVWDLLSGGRLYHVFSNHQKTITSLTFDGTHQRLISTGLDRHLKVYSVADYHVLHSLSYPAPILSVAMSPSDSHVTVGMTTRLLSVRCRPYKEAVLPSYPSLLAPPTKSSRLVPGTHRYFMRGINQKPAEDEYLVSLSHKPKLQQYETCLKSFKFKQALDAVLEVANSKGKGKATLVYSVLQELARMDRLHSAIAGRSSDEIIPLIVFLRKNLLRYNFTSFLVDVCEIVIDTYGQSVVESKEMLYQLTGLRNMLLSETRFQTQAFELMGVVDTLLTAATVNWRNKGGVANERVASTDSTITDTHKHYH